jgi:hypothetical protein
MGEKPTAAFISLIAGILILLSGIFVAVIGSKMAEVALPGLPRGPVTIEQIRGMITVMGFLGAIFGIIVIIGAFLIRTGEKGKVKAGSVIVLIFSILSIFAGMGFVIGLILGIIGGILGLVWKLAEKAPS